VIGVRFTKWGGALHWHYELQRLGEDEHGVWVGAPIGTVLQRGHEPSSIEEQGWVGLVPWEATWSPLWNRTKEPEVYVDVTTRASWDGNTVHMVDLDLDVVRHRDGSVAILDEDEFAEHQVALGYPAEVIAEAEATAAWLVEALTARVEPFGDVGAAWLRRLGPSGRLSGGHG